MREKEGKIRKKRPQSGSLDRDERVQKRTRLVWIKTCDLY